MTNVPLPPAATTAGVASVTTQTADVPDGQVVVLEIGDGWYQVQIGRARRVKRFNLRDTEARQLVALLTKRLGL
jgi:hypothetical protein